MVQESVSSLGSLTLLNTGTWLGLKYQVWIFYYLMDLKYYLMTVGYL